MTGGTWPKLLLDQAKKYGDKRVALRHKEYGVWREYTWKEYFEKVKLVSLGLIDLGLQPAEKIMVLGYNDPHLYWAILGGIAGRGVATTFPPDATPSETKYVMAHSDSRWAIVQDQGQVDKILALREEMPKLEKIIYWNPKGMQDYQDPMLMDFHQLLRRGKEFESTHPRFFDQLVETSKEEDKAVLLYTSGTQALPKGVQLTHQAGIRSARKCLAAISRQEDFEVFSHMPLTWFSAFPLQVGIHLLNAMTVNFPEAPESALADLREIGPQFVMFTPRQWENLVRRIQLRVEEAGFLKRLCYRVFLPAGYARWEKGEQGSLLTKLKDWVASFLLLNPLKDKLGLRRVRSALTGGASISPESFRFLNALGLNLKQTYGLAEMNPVTWQSDGDLEPESVGKPVPGVEIHISLEGEIWVRGDHMFQGYYKDPEATQATLKDGWIHTGDAGAMDPSGRLIYHGRLSDRIPLRDGRSFFPRMIEGPLRFNRFIKDAVVIRKDQVMAFIQMDFETVSKWAEKNNIPYTTFSDLSQKPQVYEIIGEAIREANQTLPEEARVQKYFLLHKPFSADESELTSSGKLKRDFIVEKFRSLWEEG